MMKTLTFHVYGYHSNKLELANKVSTHVRFIPVTIISFLEYSIFYHSTHALL